MQVTRRLKHAAIPLVAGAGNILPAGGSAVSITCTTAGNITLYMASGVLWTFYCPVGHTYITDVDIKGYDLTTAPSPAVVAYAYQLG